MTGRAHCRAVRAAQHGAMRAWHAAAQSCTTAAEHLSRAIFIRRVTTSGAELVGPQAASVNHHQVAVLTWEAGPGPAGSSSPSSRGSMRELQDSCVPCSTSGSANAVPSCKKAAGKVRGGSGLRTHEAVVGPGHHVRFNASPGLHLMTGVKQAVGWHQACDIP
jgi:hypothetical protein